MRTKILIIISVFFSIYIANAQSGNSTSNVKINYSIEDDSGKDYDVNISITNTDLIYTLNASFPKHRTEDVKRFFNKYLDAKMIKKGSSFYWEYLHEEKEGYAVVLKKGKLSITVDKGSISIDMAEDLIESFDDLKDLLKDKE